MKRTIQHIIISLFVWVSFIANAQPPTSISIIGSSVVDIYLNPNSIYVVDVLPFGADNSVTWSSDNPTVGIIDSTGLFTALSSGTVTISATSKIATTIIGTLFITVLNSAPPIPSITGISTFIGFPGTELVIDGINFTEGSEVYFGTTFIPFNSQTTSQIRVTVPYLESDIYTLNVRNGGIPSNDLFFQIINPRIVDILPTKARPGQIIDLYGFELNYITDIFFGGNVPGTIVGIGSGLIQVKVPENSYTSPLNLSVENGIYTRLTDQVFVYERNTSAPVFSISPLVATPGETLTLTGFGFATIFNQNIVQFQNNVVVPISGNTNFLIVPVPTVSGNGLIEVTNLQNSLSGISLNAFSPLGSSILALNSSSFSTSGVFLNSNAISEIRYTDFNNDGRPDLFMASSGQSYIIRNTDMYQGLNLDVKNGVLPSNLQNFTFGDITGDGLIDILAVEPIGIESYVTCFKNTFSGGDITFEKYFTFIGQNFVRKLALKDINGDGKLEILLLNTDGVTELNIYEQNPSDVTQYDLSSTMVFTHEIVDLGFEDMNGDGLPELIGIESIYGDISFDRVIVNWNYSSTNNIRFGFEPIIIGQLPYASFGKLDFQNLDMDVDIDIGISYEDGLAVFYNYSELGRLVFLQHNVLSSRSNFFKPLYKFLTDFNGDGITDVATIRNDGIYQNMDFYLGQPGPILTFNSAFGVTYTGSSTGFAFQFMPIDINMDGKMDVLANDFNSDFFFLINNATMVVPPQIVDIQPKRGFTNATVTIIGSGFSGTSNVVFGGQNIPYTLINDFIIVAKLEAGLTYVDNQFKVYNTAGESNANLDFTIVNSFDPDSLLVVVLGDGKKSFTNVLGLPVQVQQLNKYTNSFGLTFASDTNYRLPGTDIRYGAITNSAFSADLTLASLGPNPFATPDFTDSLGNYQTNVFEFTSTFDPSDLYNYSQFSKFKPLPFSVISNPARLLDMYVAKQMREVQFYNRDALNLSSVSQGLINGASRLRIFNDVLYASVYNLGIIQIGQSVPRDPSTFTGIILTTALGTLGTSNPVDFFISSSLSFALVCDARKGAEGGGLYLFTNSGTNWDVVYKLHPEDDGAGHLYVDQKSNPFQVYYTTSAFTQNAIYKFPLDTLALGNVPVPTLIMRAKPNMAFRGIALSPSTINLNGKVNVVSARINATSFETGDIISIAYTITGTPNTNEYMTIQLSDEFGMFSNSLQLGLSPISSPVGVVTATLLGFSILENTNYLIKIAPSDNLIDGAFILSPFIKYRNAPVNFEFRPMLANRGDVVSIIGINYELSTVTGIEYNGIPAAFKVITDQLMLTTLPGGNTTGPVRLQYKNSSRISGFYTSGNIDTNSVSVPLEYIQITADSFTIRTPNGRLPLSIRYFPVNATRKGVIWYNSDTNVAVVDSLGVVMAKSNGIVTIRAEYTFNNSISDNVIITITGQFIPLVSISVNAENNLNILSLATKQIPVNVTYTPTDATISKIHWTLRQSVPNLVTLDDSLQGMVAMISGRNENGIVTLTGTSAQGDTIQSSWVFTVIGKIIKDETKVVQSRPTANTSGSNEANPCLATLELYIEDENYIDFQWYFINNTNDTLKILGEKTNKYRPVIEGRYFIRAVRADATIEYTSYSVQLPNLTTPLLRQLKDASGLDTMLICSAPFVRTQWFVNNRFIVGQTDSTLRLWYNGSYHAVANYVNGCKQRTESIVIVRPDFIDILQSGLRYTDTTIENYLKLYAKPTLRVCPNPANETLRYEFISALGVTSHVNIYNNMGHQVLTTLCKPENGSIHTLDIHDLPRGIYTLQIVEKNIVVNTKFIKQ